MYSEADKDSTPAQDKLILLGTQKMLELNLCKVEEGGRHRTENLYKYIQSPGGPNAFTQIPASLLKITSTAGGKRLGSSSVCVRQGNCVMEDRKTQGQDGVEDVRELRKKCLPLASALLRTCSTPRTRAAAKGCGRGVTSIFKIQKEKIKSSS